MNNNRNRAWLRRLAPYLIAALFVVLLVLGFRPSPLVVEAEPVTRGHLAVTVEEEGRTRIVDRYVVSAPLLAQSRRITLQPGDPVAEGDVLVTLDAVPSPISDVRSITEARARVRAAEATLSTAQEEAQAAEAAARYYQDEAKRLRRLSEQNLAAPNLVEQAETEAQRSAALFRSAQFQVRAAEAQLEAARAALTFAGGQDPEASGVIELRAPVSGQVLTRHFESARVVQAGEPILEIGDPARLEVEVDVLSADAVRIAPGMRVLFERWGDPEVLEGRVRRVEPRAFTRISALGVEEQRVWVISDIVSPPEQWRRLGDGYRINARFILWEADRVLRIPTTALFRQGESWAAFAVEDGRARLRPVAIGRRGALHTEVLSGVAEGEQVIVHPGRDLEDDVRVDLRE